MTIDLPPAWLSLGPALIGLTFVWAGAIKAIAPHSFRRHLGSLGWIPFKYQEPSVTTAASAEVAWGVALISAAAPGYILPATVALLAILTAISWWGVKSGKAKDCGCYGGFIQPSIAESLAINATFALLAGAAWVGGSRDSTVQLWQLTAIATAGAAAGVFAHVAQRFESKNGRPMLDTSPLKVGRNWKHSWADDATKGVDGEVLVAYLGANCPYCSQFVKVANVMVQSQSLPKVIGVMAAPASEVAAYKREYEISFPVVTVSDSLMGRLTRAVPTAVIVESGSIREMWVGTMPPAVVDRFRDAFFPSVAKPATELAG